MNRPADSEEIHRVARGLLQLAERLNATSAQPVRAPAALSPAMLLDRAEKLYRLRRLRGRHFDERLFGEPAWDLLLDLFIQGERGAAVSVSSACVAAAVPTTTALRWITTLVRNELIDQTPDQMDGRRKFIKLSQRGRRMMIEFLLRAE
ncbi:helix-turn-helix domain-containing protein [Sandarakinorhabdus rubra]|uniref:MarR family transcriptional regulator n=1 Tax=Sandarakinorhabdus rubra TaxID=2672568 RepID=UPI0013DBB1E7|nr:MarR family transcriptional regulator [Sandarakinorhabdus rubra]